MVVMKEYEIYVKEVVKVGVDFIIFGVGLFNKLLLLVKGSNVKIVFIVLIVKVVNVILKMWDRKEKIIVDLIVVEGLKVGGYFGYFNEEFDNIDFIDYDKEFVEILKVVNIYGEKFGRNILVVVVGGIIFSSDVKKYIDMGVSGV